MKSWYIAIPIIATSSKPRQVSKPGDMGCGHPTKKKMNTGMTIPQYG